MDHNKEVRYSICKDCQGSQDQAPGQPLPQWQSHKKVWGDKIVEVRKEDDNEDQRLYRIVWVLTCGGIIHTSQALRLRVPTGTDPIGGYYVLYSDGLESWSPKKAFEEGYTKISA